jgi:hypothetical protein
VQQVGLVLQVVQRLEEDAELLEADAPVAHAVDPVQQLAR